MGRIENELKQVKNSYKNSSPSRGAVFMRDAEDQMLSKAVSQKNSVFSCNCSVSVS